MAENRIPEATWVVIPAYNEGAAIGDVIAGIMPHTRNIVVVDDGSRDMTATIARDRGAVVVRHAMNRGQGAAIQTGIEFALRRGAQIIITFDSDGQHAAEDLAALAQPIAEKRAEVALGSRFLSDSSSIPALRRAVLKIGVAFTRLTSGLRVTDAHNGLRAFSRKAAEGIDIKLDRMAHASELMDHIRRSNLSYVEVPVRIRYTDYSRTKGQRGVHALRIVFDYFIGKWVR